MARVIRFANEGFAAHDLKNVERKYSFFDERLDPVANPKGCFAFCERVYYAALDGISQSRRHETKHEMEIDDNALVWARNTAPKESEGAVLSLSPIYSQISAFDFVLMPISKVLERFKLFEHDEKDKLGFLYAEIVVPFGEQGEQRIA